MPSLGMSSGETLMKTARKCASFTQRAKCGRAFNQCSQASRQISFGYISRLCKVARVRVQDLTGVHGNSLTLTEVIYGSCGIPNKVPFEYFQMTLMKDATILGGTLTCIWSDRTPNGRLRCYSCCLLFVWEVAPQVCPALRHHRRLQHPQLQALWVTRCTSVWCPNYIGVVYTYYMYNKMDPCWSFFPSAQ